MDLSDDEQLKQDQQYSSFPDFQHLNIDLCMELIFPYLNLTGLLNAADSCREMRGAAENTFAQKYRNTLVWIDIRESNNPFEYDTFLDTLYVRGPKICLKVLRCFGQLISKLKLTYRYERTAESIYIHLDQYVIDYCAKHIKEIEFDTCLSKIYE